MYDSKINFLAKITENKSYSDINYIIIVLQKIIY